MIFAFGFPILQVCLFFSVVGTFPDDTKVGIVNEEMGNFTNCEDYKLHNKIGGILREDNYTCEYTGLACKFVDYLGEKLQNKVNKSIFAVGSFGEPPFLPVLKIFQVYFYSKEEGMHEVKKGTIRQMLYFPYNFSKVVTLIRDRSTDLTDDEIEMQRVKVYRDSVGKKTTY